MVNELEDVVLLGHSYAGMVTTGVENILASRLRHHVYLDAYIPQPNQSAFGIRTAEAGAAVPLDFDSISLTVPCPDPSHHGLHGPVLDWARRRMTPMPKQCWLTTLPDQVEKIDNARLRRHFVRLRQFPAFYFDTYARQLATNPDWTYQEHDLPHNCFMMDPEWLVDLLWPLITEDKEI